MVFIKSLLQSVFSKTMFDHLSDKQKFHAISLKQSLYGAGTIEFRNVRPYQQGDHVELIANAIIARRDYLKKNPGTPLLENHSSGLDDGERFEAFIKYINQIGLNEQDYFPLLPKETIPMVLKRLDHFKQGQYLIDYAKFTAFNDLERQAALIEALTSMDDLHIKKHVIYILLEKANGTESFRPFLESAKGPLTTLDISPEKFLEEYRGRYSPYSSKTQFNCSEVLSIILN